MVVLADFNGELLVKRDFLLQLAKVEVSFEELLRLLLVLRLRDSIALARLLREQKNVAVVNGLGLQIKLVIDECLDDANGVDPLVDLHVEYASDDLIEVDVFDIFDQQLFGLGGLVLQQNVSILIDQIDALLGVKLLQNLDGLSIVFLVDVMLQNQFELLLLLRIQDAKPDQPIVLQRLYHQVILNIPAVLGQKCLQLEYRPLLLLRQQFYLLFYLQLFLRA